ncbi:MAG TPA: prenyltransferase [Acidimicrobiia bacterium]|nr:prenyltransferase [Acidimicrobiia bacterium]
MTQTVPERGAAGSAAAPARTNLLANWKEALSTGNLPEHGRVDGVTKWLVLTRAAVLPMTLTSGIVAALLAVGHPDLHTGWLALALLGIVLAHVSNNLMNDLADMQVGTDTDDYPRALYAPHPVLSGLVTKKGLLAIALVVNVADLAIMLALFAARGWPVVAFALAGFFLSVAYTSPPLRLKKRGLGEPTVLVVWGPLMVGGTYYAATGEVTWPVIAVSIPYALLSTAVLMGKHIDKLEWDERDGTRTLPVILGEARARRATQVMMAAFYPGIALLVVLDWLPATTLVALLGVTALRKVWSAFAQPRPAEPPRRWPIWPLWFAALAFVHTRRAGALFIVGLAAGAALGWT